MLLLRGACHAAEPRQEGDARAEAAGGVQGREERGGVLAVKESGGPRCFHPGLEGDEVRGQGGGEGLEDLPVAVLVGGGGDVPRQRLQAEEGGAGL